MLKQDPVKGVSKHMAKLILDEVIESGFWGNCDCRIVELSNGRFVVKVSDRGKLVTIYGEKGEFSA